VVREILSDLAGIATGANYPLELDTTTRFFIEVAKSFGLGLCQFYDEEEFTLIKSLYGSMKRLQTLGGEK